MGTRDVVAFIHTYAVDGDFDPFMTSLMDGFGRAGARLHVIRTNDLVEHLGAKALLPSISEDAILDIIEEIDPAFVFSTNRGGITRQIAAGVKCPIVSWFVDHVPFQHDVGDERSMFTEKDHVVVSASAMVRAIEARYPRLRGRVHYLPFATDRDFFKGVRGGQDINLAFVGTYFHTRPFVKLLKEHVKDRQTACALLDLAGKLERDFGTDVSALLKQAKLEKVVAAGQMDASDFEMAAANVMSMNKRIKYLDAIADMGLELWGTENWTEVADYSMPLLQRYRFGEFVKTREQLAAVYRRSRIAVDVPHVQAVGGLPYRVFDILASPALLITEYREDSDLFRLFGDDVPVPMYRDPVELRSLVRFYLDNEEARRKTVEHCNQLVASGFSFTDRAQELFTVAGGKLVFDQRKSVSFVPKKKYSSMGLAIGRALNPAGKRLPELAGGVLFVFPFTLCYLILAYSSPKLVHFFAIATRRLLPAQLREWLIRKLVLGNGVGRNTTSIGSMRLLIRDAIIRQKQAKI